VKANGQRTIETTAFLALALAEYHQTRPQEEEREEDDPDLPHPRDRDPSFPPQGQDDAYVIPYSTHTKATKEERDIDAEAALYEAMAEFGHVPSSRRGRGQAPTPMDSTAQEYNADVMLEQLEAEDAPQDSTEEFLQQEFQAEERSPPNRRHSARQSPTDNFSFSVSPTSTEASNSPDDNRRQAWQNTQDAAKWAVEIMQSADKHHRNSRLSVNEMRTFLRGTEFVMFMNWLSGSKGKRGRMAQFDRDGDGTIDMEELEAAVGTFLDEGGVFDADQVAMPSASPVQARGPVEIPPDEVTMQIVMDLRTCLVEDTQNYLDTIMKAAQGLPPTVLSEIREEVETRLQARVASTLSDVLQAYNDPNNLAHDINARALKEQVNELISNVLDAAEAGGTWDGDAEDMANAEALGMQYTTLLQGQLYELAMHEVNGDDDDIRRHKLSEFSRALLGAPDIRREVEPLVAFLVIFAKEADGS